MKAQIKSKQPTGAMIDHFWNNFSWERKERKNDNSVDQAYQSRQQQGKKRGKKKREMNAKKPPEKPNQMDKCKGVNGDGSHSITVSQLCREQKTNDLSIQ